MKKVFFRSLLLIVPIIVCSGFLNTKDTYADEFVSSASVMWYANEGYSWWDDYANQIGGHSVFDVSLTWGERCAGGRCEIVYNNECPGWLDENGVCLGWRIDWQTGLEGWYPVAPIGERFWCNDGGQGLDEWGGNDARHINGGGMSTNIYTVFVGSADGYDYYYVNIIPPRSDWQPIQGAIRVRRDFRLDVVGKNIYNSNDISDGDILPAVTGNGWVSATRMSLDTAKFICWKTGISSGSDGCILNTNYEFDPFVSGWDGSAYAGYNKYLTDDHVVYAYYAPKYTLTINADIGTNVTVEREESPYGDSTGGLPDGSTIYGDDKLKVCVDVQSGYTLQSYTIQEGSNAPASVSSLGRYCADARYYVEDDTIITVTVNRDEFYGKSMVSSMDGVWSSSNGISLGANDTFTQESGKVTYYINDCDPINGCTAKFWHYLKRGSGAGTTTYSVARTSNYASVSGGEIISRRTAEGFNSDGILKVREEAFVSNLKPGQVVCETLTFVANVSVGERSLTVCASALGNAQPPDPDNPDAPENPDAQSGDKTFLNIKVRNKNVTKYSDYQRAVYAKPGDTLSFRSVYNPVLQYTYSLIPERIKIDNYNKFFPSGETNESALGALFNNSRTSVSGTLKEWNNTYAVGSENFLSAVVNESHVYSAGNTSFQTNSNDHKVATSEVGSEIRESAITNTSYPNRTTTPSQVEFTKSTIGGVDYNLANVRTNQIKKTASAKIPYNYRTAISVNSGSNIVSAGETGTVNVVVDVLKKTNNETTNGDASQAYATRTANSKIQIIVYIPDDGTVRNGDENYSSDNGRICARYINASVCGERQYQTKTFNSGSNPNGKIGESGASNAPFNVPDIDAGAEICVAAAIFPSTSGADTNIDAKGSNTWNVSDSKCFTVAKEPSLQVWGGGVFSKKALKTSVSRKNNLNGYADYSINSNNRYFVFGSGTELDVVAFGTITGFSSGASTGFSHIDDGVLWPSYNSDNTSDVDSLTAYGPGGSFETGAGFCLRSVLSFANGNCSDSSGSAGNIGGSGQNDSEKNKLALIDRFRNVSDIESIEYEKKTGDYTISENIVVERGKTKVIDAENLKVTIDSNIDFLNAPQPYEKISDIPKLIIFANNIEINCAVTQIDAVLVAENDIKTCYDSEDKNDKAHSNQLIINGSIITDTLTADRTYGAAKGVNSVIPAEIINYDTTLYLWGANRADTSDSAGLNATYIHELAPRY